jgi:hypothetical protein
MKQNGKLGGSLGIIYRNGSRCSAGRGSCLAVNWLILLTVPLFALPSNVSMADCGHPCLVHVVFGSS